MTDRTPLVGRGAEIDRLDEVIGEVTGGRAGSARVVDLTGPAGMGKSRLLTEVCGRARERGLTVLRGRAAEYERHIPFHLFTDAFADLDPEQLRGRGPDPSVAPVVHGGTPPTSARPRSRSGSGSGPRSGGGADPAAAAASYPDTASYPGAGSYQGGAPSPFGGGPGAPVDRFAVHRATARMLAALAGPGGPSAEGVRGTDGASGTTGRSTGGGLLVALDDLHWADPASLELLDHLVRHPPRAPVIVVVARRDRQTSPSLAAALTRGVDTGAVLRMDLGPLGERACVEQLAAGTAPARAARLYAASEGNPLYFLTLLQGQGQGPGQVEGSGRDRRHGPHGAGPAAPAGDLSALLLDELTPLTDTQRRTAEAVAVLGDHATAPLLALTLASSLAVSDPRRLDADLGVLADRDLVRRGPGGSWSLRHPVLRTVVHENTEHGRRTDMHRRAAAALAGAGASAAVRAHHVERSLTGWDPEAAAVLLEAAGQSETTAPASCAHWLGTVLRVLPDTPEHRARRRELVLRRARALSVCGELRASRDLLHELIARPGKPGSPVGGVPLDGHAADGGALDGPDGLDEEDGGLRASAVTLCASMERHLGQYGPAVALLRRELARRPAPRPGDALALGLELGSSAPHALPYPEVREDVLRTLELARRLGDEPAEAGALTITALGETYGGDLVTARELTDSAGAKVDALADRELAGLCEPLARLSWAEFYLERYADAERHAERGLALARRVVPLHLLPHLLLCKAIVLMNTCRPAPALELVDEAESIARGIGSDELLALVLSNKAQVLLVSLPPGDGGSLAVAEEAVALTGGRSSWWASLAWCVLSYTALHGGDPRRARSAMLRAGGGPELARLQPTMRPLFLEALVTAAVTTGDLADAEAWSALAAADAERLGLPAQRASALRSAGQVLAGRGEPGPAADRYARAAEEAARSGATLWESQALLIASSFTARSGDPATAASQWHRGRSLAAAGGAHLLTGLADLFPPPSPAPLRPPSAPAPPRLTPREEEIAVLVTEGLTTRAIAARLYVSPRTVDTHLNHIFSKLGVTTRSALAALTARRLP
ncbi:AAA family ATPase [Streptomyces sp. NPDC006544]|uniref:helix-turn-helix transcriptional regulator n=1 Tax=Streptomyces sp. NPDC006544 TaxID=3154583 RepID=UPI0033BE40FD